MSSKVDEYLSINTPPAPGQPWTTLDLGEVQVNLERVGFGTAAVNLPAGSTIDNVAPGTGDVTLAMLAASSPTPGAELVRVGDFGGWFGATPNVESALSQLGFHVGRLAVCGLSVGSEVSNVIAGGVQLRTLDNSGWAFKTGMNADFHILFELFDGEMAPVDPAAFTIETGTAGTAVTSEPAGSVIVQLETDGTADFKVTDVGGGSGATLVLKATPIWTGTGTPAGVPGFPTFATLTFD